MLQRLLPIAFATSLLAVLATGQTPASSASDWRTFVDDALASKEYQQALERAELALEYFPDEGELLAAAAGAAQEAGETDLALWYADLALQALTAELEPAAKDRPAAVVELGRIVELVDPLARRGDQLIVGYRQALFEAARIAARRKLSANAVDLFTKCRELGHGPAADAELAKIYDSKKAVEALLEAGLDVPLAPKRRKKSAETIAREDSKHASFENPYEIKGNNYTIRTNLGFELAESISRAMEQMNGFYRKVFKVRERGGNTARVVIHVYRTRAEFEKYENLGPEHEGMLAFFVPLANRVAAYDLREHGYAMSELWSTLFHEASHQFTHLVSADLIPGWLNEGTASYFEGARLLPNGSVEANLIPEERLFYLEQSLQAGSPTLKDVVSYYQPGSYDGSFYPFGWGLVYFLLNYENDASERIYTQAYQDYMAAYGSGGKHDPFGRFVEYFVTKVKDPAVKSFEDFETRWKTWILELFALHYGGADKADDLIARARRQLAAKKLESAEQSLRWALRKRPGDVTALVELGDLLAREKAADSALYFYRRAQVAARAASDGAGAAGERAAKQVAALDAEFGKALGGADAKLFGAASATAREYAEKEFPRAGLRLLDRVTAATGGTRELADARKELCASSGVDSLRWRRPRLESELAQWERGPMWQPDGDALFAKSPRVAFATWKERLPGRYRLEVKLENVALEQGGFAAVVFGSGDNGLQYFGLDDDGLAEVGRLRKTWEPFAPLGRIPKEMLKSLDVAIDAAPDKTVFSLNGVVVHERPYAADELTGSVGFVLQDGSAGFRGLRVRY